MSIGSGPAAAGSVRPKGVPNATVIWKRRVCLGSARSRHPSFDGDCALSLGTSMASITRWI
jgi:hypothetical protein